MAEIIHEELYDRDESFRDSIATINDEGKRNWIYSKKPSGKFTNRRTILSYVLLAFLFSGPFIRIGGQPLLMLNVVDRKFIILGQIFWPQDFYLFVLAMLTFILFVIVFTVAFGRLFCGWVCPQTIFLEMVFRKIEYWIEGDFKHQRQLDNMPWNAEKMRKKGLKWSIFFAISFLISNTFLMYLIGSDAVISIVTDPPSEHIQGLTSILIFTGVFYFVFAWFREQACIVVCPYGRLQGVMLDRNSVVVAYDYLRGEKRAKWKKGDEVQTTDGSTNRKVSGRGDCIDCHQCVNVCPTGIDIRNGTQLECVNCTACIDACDDIMEKVGLPKGLIRYDSEKGIAEKTPWKISTRTTAYIAVLTVLMSIFFILLLGRNSVEASLLRTPGQLYQKNDHDRISNLYNFKVINKTNEEMNLHIKLLNYNGEIKFVGDSILTLPSQGTVESVIFILLNHEDLNSVKSTIEVGVFSNGEMIESVKSNFLGPNK